MKVGDVVKVKLPGVIRFGEFGRVVKARMVTSEVPLDLGTLMVKVKFDDYEVEYSEGCLEKVKTYRSIDDE